MSLHIGASKGQIAESILLPGDPLRARHISEKFLENPLQYNAVRNMLGFTGDYKGTKVSIQGTGMGMPSISIYVEELIREYGARNLIRTGTCGAIDPELKLGDLVIALSASTDSNMNNLQIPGGTLAPHGSFDLIRSASELAVKYGVNAVAGGVLSSDFFYSEDPNGWKKWADFGMKVIEMETSALYTIGLRNRVNCLSILTVSDVIPTGERASTDDREKGFDAMAEIALEVIHHI